MPWAIFLAVAAVWAMFLIPRWWADRASQSPGSTRPDFRPLQRSNSEAGFGRQIERVLARSDEDGGPVTHREAVLARRRRMASVLLGAAVASLAAWFVLNSLWMLLIHVIVDAVFVWYIMMLRRIRAFREDVNALFADHEYVAPTRDHSAIRVVQPR